MAIAASGAVSLSDFRTEFVGGSAAISLGDLYRGGSNIRAKAGNSSATNLAASVPTSGTIDFNDFYSTAKGFQFTYTSGATNQNINSKFGDDYGVNYPKFAVINSGVELGATSTSNYALVINSGLSGTITLTNNGTISGAGGSANGGTGGDALSFSSSNSASNVIFNNNGTVRAGGGGGGQGGTGGQGQTSSTGWGNTWTRYSAGSPFTYTLHYQYTHAYFFYSWDSVNVADGATWGTPYTVTVGNYRYYPGSSQSFNGSIRWYQVTRQQYSTTYSYHSGGSGGSGGVGQGYGQSAGSGSGGSGGGTNAGNGGSGGGGGSFGNSGSSGNSGGNGNYTNGSGGSGGGSAGRYRIGSSYVTFNNNGTVQGGTA